MYQAIFWSIASANVSLQQH